MKNKTIVSVLLILLCGYSILFIYDQLLSLALVLVTAAVVMLSVFILVCLLVAARVFPAASITAAYNAHREKTKLIIVICALFLYIGGWLINRYCLPDKFHPISFIGNGTILCFAVFLGWGLYHLKSSKKIMIVGIALFGLLIYGLHYAGAGVSRYVAPSGFEELASLPYLGSVPAVTDKEGVVIHDPAVSYAGLNLYTYPDSAAYLMDREGNVVHTWSADGASWGHVVLRGDGGIIGIAEDKSLLCVDRDSRVRWEHCGRFHHDAAIADNGDIYALRRNDEIVFYQGMPLPVLNDYITILSADGRVKADISLYEILKDSVKPGGAARIYRWLANPVTPLMLLENKILKRFAFDGWFMCPADIFHSNTVAILNRPIPGFCKKGDLLICIRNMDLVAVLDPARGTLRWRWGPGELRMPHHPTLLENGNILVFDNGWERKFSRVVELDLRTRDIVWEYRGNPPETFFSLKRGATQRLPNGNTLITESDKGRVFEVTPDGRIVWEFYSPLDKTTTMRKAIYRMLRIEGAWHREQR